MDSSSIREWQKDAYANASAHGFHDGDTSENEGDRIAVYAANLTSEVSELWEAYRAGKLREPCDKVEKMKALGLHPLSCGEEELADIVIRCLDVAESLGIDLGRAISTKHAYNVSRPHRHGGKLA